MKIYHYIYVALISVTCIMLVSLFGLNFEKKAYQKEIEMANIILKDKTVTNYFVDEKYTISYQPQGLITEGEKVVGKQLCIDCDDSIATMHNTNTYLITSAPAEVCDTEVERCMLYSYDPFGIKLFRHEELIKQAKEL